jgi:hypothetical protein
MLTEVPDEIVGSTVLTSLHLQFNNFKEIPSELLNRYQHDSSFDLCINGNPLTIPVHDNDYTRTESSRFSIGCADMRGKRPIMEDAVCVVGEFGGPSGEFIGLFDGMYLARCRFYRNAVAGS